MRKLLLKFAHFILKKYSVIPLEFKDKVWYEGRVFEIQSATIHREFFKTDLELKMCDCFKLHNVFKEE